MMCAVFKDPPSAGLFLSCDFVYSMCVRFRSTDQSGCVG